MKDVRMSFAVTVALQQTDVHWLEADLLRQRQAIFLAVFRQVLTAIEAAVLLAPLGPCPACGGRQVQNGRVPRRLETLLGRLQFERVRLRCQQCGRESFPLDGALGLEARTQQTLGVRERALWAATEVSYEKSTRFLAKFTGLAVSRGTIHTLAREEGTRLLTQDAAQRQAVFEQGQAPPPATQQPPVLFIQVDGTGVRNRATRTSMETKVGVVFSERARVSANRIELIDKRCVASLEPAQAFGESLWLEAVRHGLEQAAQVVFISDGAAWIKGVHATHFPQALYVLDLWHLERALRLTLGAEHSEIPALVAAATAGQPDEILRRLRRLAVRTRGPDAHAALRQLIEYVQTNAEGIRNLPRAPLWGSGAVEKQADVLVARRFKTRGMSWYRPGAAALQRLRLLKLNGDWDAYWEARQHELARQAA